MRGVVESVNGPPDASRPQWSAGRDHWPVRGGGPRRWQRSSRSAPRGMIYPLLLIAILVMGIATMGVAELWQTQVKRE